MVDTTFGYKRDQEAMEKYIKKYIPHPDRLTENQLAEIKERYIK